MKAAPAGTARQGVSVTQLLTTLKMRLARHAVQGHGHGLPVIHLCCCRRPLTTGLLSLFFIRRKQSGECEESYNSSNRSRSPSKSLKDDNDNAITRHCPPATIPPLRPHNPPPTSQLTQLMSLKTKCAITLKAGTKTHLALVVSLLRASREMTWPHMRRIGGLLSVDCCRNIGQANME
ncbi:hypothetical protein E2C01_018922 [Portunus trituberculatus]|uniref:Uncharacterized protein n=1 Tax=Portunus trituberculatus TaxID=210409 RepID=A0A5B7DXI1_PORTR|nr:hypothetical protein [Portunus trituberculatus]